MNKSILFVLTLFLINTISYFSGSNVIYASRSILMNSFMAKSTYVSKAVPVEESPRSRDYKIPEDESENTSYRSDRTTPYIDLNTSSDTEIIPWKGPKLVVIDPGHGGYDPGAVDKGLVEKEINLDVSLRVYSILKKSGVLVLLTRKDDSFSEPRERIDFANKKEAALFVSIHSNWMRDTSLHGTMTLYYPSQRLRAGYLNEIDYATGIQQELMNGIGTSDRGIIDRPNLTVLKHAKMPSVLIELGFMSNPSDAVQLSSDDFRQKSAEGIAKGIIKALNKIDPPK
ncbi:MAG: N-acetylmuramoyl-L-alanine amidase [Clostridia bacterium]|nr:N-acetylmuramoyl-L-alanine amidase [Clostridia bacterium]